MLAVERKVTSIQPLVAVLIACAACGPPAPDTTLTSRWLRYHHWSDETPCPEALHHLDALVDFVADRFSFTATKIDYYKWRTNETADVESVCGGKTACASGTNAYSTAWAHDHEVIHSLFSPIGYPPQLFVEGVAMVYGCGLSAYRGGPIDTAVDFDHLVLSTAWEDDYQTHGTQNYEAAGSFVRWLVDTHGEAPFLKFYAQASHTGDASSRRTFHEIFGSPFQEALTSWRASGPRPAGTFCLVEVDPCAGPTDIGPDSGPVSRELSCIGTVASVESGQVDAAAFGVGSSTVPVSISFESCDVDSNIDTEYLLPPDLPGLPKAAVSPTTPGRHLEVRTFGLGNRVLLRVHASQFDDTFGGLRPATPGGSAAGTVTINTLREPGRLWSPDCDGGMTQLDQGAWGLHLAGDVSAIPPSGGVLRIHSDQPLRTVSSGWVGIVPNSCPLACGLPVDGGCDSFGLGETARSALSLRLDSANAGGRFKLDLGFNPD